MLFTQLESMYHIKNLLKVSPTLDCNKLVGLVIPFPFVLAEKEVFLQKGYSFPLLFVVRAVSFGDPEVGINALTCGKNG